MQFLNLFKKSESVNFDFVDKYCEHVDKADSVADGKHMIKVDVVTNDRRGSTINAMYMKVFQGKKTGTIYTSLKTTSQNYL